MLELRNVSKIYQTGDITVHALNDVSIAFRRNEFVSILGPSGGGKTTLLNLVGGLDQYTSGDLLIDGRSTKAFTDRDWDSYRNHSVGFVFQSYNLIPHQTALANVELALTLSGVSSVERKKRAKEALEAVGLGDQLHKKPGQLSGGQMQRVAIARALVNNPDILLADEPTGALDSDTSVQVLDTLKEVARDRLVIMVTHNRELADRYSTRIVGLKDGQIVSDSNPYATDAEDKAPAKGRRIAMGFGTALSLSLNNLLTKRGRTLLTAFAGSIGIIGIALILSLSTGVNNYINRIQRDTMASYPIVIEAESINLGSMMTSMRDFGHQEHSHDLDAVYANPVSTQSQEWMNTSISQNNLTALKAYLETPDNILKPYLSSVSYSYDASFTLMAYDPEGELIQTGSAGGVSGSMSSMPGMAGFSTIAALSPSEEDGLPGDAIKAQYELLAGDWPARPEDVVLVIDDDNEISDYTLYELGLLPQRDLRAAEDGSKDQILAQSTWQYQDLIGHSFYAVPDSFFYIPNAKGYYVNARDDQAALKQVIQLGIPLKVSGILRAGASATALKEGGMGYTQALLDLVIEKTEQSAAVTAQMASPHVNVLNGLAFAPETDSDKADQVRQYIQGLMPSQKAALSEHLMRLFPAGDTEEIPDSQDMNLSQMMDMFQSSQGSSLMGALDPAMMDQLMGMAEAYMQGSLSGLDETQKAAMLDLFIQDASEEKLVTFYDAVIAKEAGTYSGTLHQLGVVDKSAPSAISLYTDSFEAKEGLTDAISRYNSTANEANQIHYTDFVALFTSSVTTIVNVITYVLVAFVAVSLIVSSIMIGIITYISVLERTKEIGILRAVGASKKDVSRVFTAETVIIGLAAGLIGVISSMLLTIPINMLIHTLANDSGINAVLPPISAGILILISVLLSMVAGRIPARLAAKKDPVVALRSE
ncbi:MAG: ATP-binding cassette domain-containing protein [Christensenellales bacterium]